MATTRKRASVATSPALTIGSESKATPIRVRLVGHDYNVYLPKGATGLELARLAKLAEGEDMDAQLEIIDRLIDSMFSASDAERVKARLQQPEDALDLGHLIELSQALGEQVSENPTM